MIPPKEHRPADEVFKAELCMVTFQNTVVFRPVLTGGPCCLPARTVRKAL